MTWMRRVGPRPHVRIEERWDRGGEIYARWWDSRPDGRRPGGGWRRRALGIRLRPRLDAEIDVRAEADALELAGRMRDALGRGADPSNEVVYHVHQVLSQYLAEETDGLGRRYQRDLERGAEVLEELLGAATSWATLGPGAGPTVWRALAARSVDGAGRRWAERTVELLWRAAAWAEREGLVAPGLGPRPTARWRSALGRDWGRVSGVQHHQIAHPRYTEAELRALWSAITLADPRLQVALAVSGPELRLGQAARARRRDLALDLGVGEHGLGRVRIPGCGNKHGVTIDLDAHARRVLDQALAGHLGLLEAAHRQGAIEDYPLVPGGPMTGREVAVGPASMRSVAEATLRRWYRAWEARAGVRHVAGRGWHAARRAASDLAADLATDPDVLDAVGGWAAGSGVRARVYRDHRDARVRIEAERLRTRLRARVRAPTEPAPHRTHVFRIGADSNT